MNDPSTHTPQDFVVHEGLIIPLRMLQDYDAHIRPATETTEYQDAYERCTVPRQTSFRDFAELDDEITRQLQAAKFEIAVVPDIQAKLKRLVYRIRNTWTVKYGLKFGSQVVFNGTAPPGILQVVPLGLLEVREGLLRPVSSTLTAGANVAPCGIMRAAGGETVNAFPAGIQQPNTVPGMPAPYVPPDTAPPSDLTIHASQPTEPVNSKKSVRFADGNVAPPPLFADGKEPHLSPYFERVYKSLDKIYTASKRKMTEQIMKDLPHESVARCMEALWRYNDDVDSAEAWLRLTSSSSQDKHVIEVFDSDDENQMQIGEPGHRRAKKKQTVDKDLPALTSKQAKKKRNRKNRDMGTLQKPSTKAILNLLASPKQFSLNLDNFRPQPLLGPGSSLGDSTWSNDAPDFIPLDVARIAPSSTPKHTQVEVIDLTDDGGDPMDLDKSHRRPNPAMVGAPAMTGPLSSRQVLVGSARAVTPDPVILENIFQYRSNAGIPLQKPMEVHEITAAITSHEQVQKFQSITTAAQAEQATNAEQSLNNQLTDDSGAGEAMETVSELEEGEIREDEPTAAVSKRASTDEQVNDNDGKRSSIKTWNGAWPEPASRRDSGFVYSSSVFGTSSNNSSFGALRNSSPFRALIKPVFGSAWQPERKDSA
jgi:hypothetical protein